MLLGGLRYLLPVIEAAHNQGYYVITADNVPDNIAHKYSDEYCNVSVIDKEAVLKEAKKLEIDGIMSFACDPGVIAASYVQNKMGLPSFGPFESVEILQNKDKFRKFLSDNGFNVPWAKGYNTLESIYKDKDILPYPVIVKPVDSAGSKGVTRVDSKEEILDAAIHAFDNSFSSRIIIEEFIELEGFSSDSDCMSVDGKLVFTNFNSQYFDKSAPNPYTPSAYSWPSTFTREQEDYLSSELQRLISLLGMQTAVYNVETRIGTNGKPYIMEVSPRGGGNRLCEMIRYATSVDLITAITRTSVGDTISKIKNLPLNGLWAEIILHTEKKGIFQGLNIEEDFKKHHLVEIDLWVKTGDNVSSFEGANNAIGTLVFKDQTEEEIHKAILNPDCYNLVISE